MAVDILCRYWREPIKGKRGSFALVQLFRASPPNENGLTFSMGASTYIQSITWSSATRSLTKNPGKFSSAWLGDEGKQQISVQLAVPPCRKADWSSRVCLSVRRKASSCISRGLLHGYWFRLFLSKKKNAFWTLVQEALCKAKTDVKVKMVTALYLWDTVDAPGNMACGSSFSNIWSEMQHCYTYPVFCQVRQSDRVCIASVIQEFLWVS